MKHTKGTGIKSTTCGLCGKEMHDIEYPRHMMIVHRVERENELTDKANEQLAREVEEEANEPRIGPDNPADWFK